MIEKTVKEHIQIRKTESGERYYITITESGERPATKEEIEKINLEMYKLNYWIDFNREKGNLTETIENGEKVIELNNITKELVEEFNKNLEIKYKSWKEEMEEKDRKIEEQAKENERLKKQLEERNKKGGINKEKLYLPSSINHGTVLSGKNIYKVDGIPKENIEFIEGQLFVDGMVYHIENTNKKPIGNMNLNLLKGIYSMVYQYVEMLDIEPTGNEISIESREIEKYLGIRLTGKNAYEIKDKLSEYRDYFGFFSKKEFYKILDFSGMKDNKFFLNVGFFLALIRKNNESKNKKKIENFNFNNVLLKTEILKERDNIAVDIVYQITNLLLQRGINKDKDNINKEKEEIKTIINETDKDGNNIEKEKVKSKEITLYPTTVCVWMNDLIEKIPALKTSIEKARETKTPTQSVNSLLKNHFKNAFRILKEKTIVYEYYRDFKINDKIPQSTEIKDRYSIEIKHNGIK